MAKLELRNLSKSFGTCKILQNINFVVNEGEFLVLVGPSGSGKSTILRLIAGLDLPTEGEIFLEGKKINNLLPKDRDVAMVFQNYALYPHMTVADNLAFPLKMANLSKDEVRKRVTEVAELLGISSHMSKKPKEISGGERQRVALGRTIVRNPKLFLMDEPLSNLDAKLRTQMRSELLNLHRKLHSTIVYVTHDQIEALTMGDRIAVINDGKIQQVDLPENIYKRPINTFVASFIGNPGMNFLNFKIISQSEIQVIDNNITFNINPQLFEKFKIHSLIGKKVILGIRPEHMYVNKNGLQLNAFLEHIEVLGNEYLLCVSYNSLQKYKFYIKLYEHCNLKPQSQIKIGFDLEHVLFFNKENGNLLLA